MDISLSEIPSRLRSSKMPYINRRSINHPSQGVETIDFFSTRREAVKMLREYSIADYSAEYYISSRSTKEWRES
jgi:hypothetical protein